VSGIAPGPPSEDHVSPALVMVISQFPDPNETFIVREVTELRRRGFAVTILSLRPPPPRVLDPEARALLPLVVYPPGGAWRVLREAWRTLRKAPRAALRAIAVGVADIAAALPTPLLAAKQALLLPLALAYGGRLPVGRCRLHAQFANVPTAVVRVLAALRGGTYSFTAHAWDIFVPENHRLLPARIAGADLVVTCTGYNRTLLAALAPSPADAAKVVLCHHGLDFAAYEPSRSRAPDLIVGGASLTEQKGLTHLVAACARLRDRGLGVRCVLIGEGPERPRLEAQIRALGLAEQVRLTGQLPHSEVVRWLREAAVFAHPSIAERRGAMDGIPNTILEALAVETPVVGTRLSGIPEAVLPDETGLLVEPGDEEGLAAALARLLADPALGRRLGAAGRALVLERFDLERNVEPLAALLAPPNAAEASPPRRYAGAG
jgi:colanic acid/amylovoran biosynthesis glycosyltransferase